MSHPHPAIPRAAAILEAANSLLVLSGAGISAESGVPTYRGPGGVYNVDPSLMDTLSEEGLYSRPHDVWDYVDRMRQKVAEVSPNPAHRTLAEWEFANWLEGDGFRRFLIATQNVDGLHQAAGSDRVSELHGSIWRLAVPREVPDPEDLDDFFRGDDREEVMRRWSRDNEHAVWEDRRVPFPEIPPSPEPDVRPDVVLFGEQYGNRLLWVEHYIGQGVDAVLIVGCSGAVSILSYLLTRVAACNPGARIINVNPADDCIETEHVFIAMPAGEALPALDAARKGA